MSIQLTMNESTKISAVAYANNTWYRRDVVYLREQILDVMPIGKPMRAKEVCDAVAETGVANIYGCGALTINPQSVVQCYNSLEPYGIMKREVVPCEPFTIMVGGYEKYNPQTDRWEWTDQKPKVIDKVTMYTRLR